MKSRTSLEDFDYDPMIFLRCHSKTDRDFADIQTQVWQASFERINNPRLVATCGGNKVCIVDVETGEIVQRYSAETREKFFSLAWNNINFSGESRSILVAGGALNIIYFIYPRGERQLTHLNLPKHSRSQIFSLLFHPDPSQENILFCARNREGVNIISVDLNTKNTVIIGCLSCDYEITRIAFIEHTLFAASDAGLCGWPLDTENNTDVEDVPLVRYRLPKNPNDDRSAGFDVVDSVEVMGKDIIACKCALHGFIYIWNFHDCVHKTESDIVNVVPRYKLRWSNTDNYYLEISGNYDIGLLSCGDDKGTIWLYDVSCLKQNERNTETATLEPVEKLLWPQVNDRFLNKSRKLDLTVYDILISKATIHPNGNYIVAVTNNNTVCIWKKCDAHQNIFDLK